MLKNDIIRLFKSGKNVREISQILHITKPYIGEVVCKSDLDLPTCKICGKKILAINTSHLKKHNYSVARYIGEFPDEKKLVKNLAWNKGLTEKTSQSVANYVAATRQRMNTNEEREKRSQQNKKMWDDNKFKTDIEICKKANKAWVQKVKFASFEDRQKLLANFTKAGNNAQQKIRNNHKLDIEFYKKKYPCGINLRINICIECGGDYVLGGSRAHAKNFCSVECCKKFIKNTPNYYYYTQHNLLNRIKMVKCRRCDFHFISVDSKWSKKFCSKECYVKWLEIHPHFCIKRHYFSEKFNEGYYYDSNYELDFIKWCEYNDKIISLGRNKPIIHYIDIKDRRYYPDFLINLNEIVEIKANVINIYEHKDREILKIKAGLAYNLNYKLITNNELYIKKSINNELLDNLIFTNSNFVGGDWVNVI